MRTTLVLSVATISVAAFAGTATNRNAEELGLDTVRIERLTFAKGTFDAKEEVFKVVFGRSTRMEEQDVGNAMGVNTWAAFVGSDERAVVDGDFAMLRSELQAVLKALRGAGIDIVAIHQHMTGEAPRILFLAYWGSERRRTSHADYEAPWTGPTTERPKPIRSGLKTGAREGLRDARA